MGDQNRKTTQWCHEALSTFMKHCKEYKNRVMPERKYPTTDIKVFKDKYVYVMNVPDFGNEVVNVSVDEKELVVSGKRDRADSTLRQYGGRYLKKDDRKPTEFDRRYPLPDDANSKKFKAQKHYGVLTVTIPKKVQADPDKPKVVAVL